MKMLQRDPSDGSLKYFEVEGPAPLTAGTYRAGYGLGFTAAGLKMLTLDLLGASIKAVGETPFGMGARDGYTSAYIKAERRALEKEISTRFPEERDRAEEKARELVPDRWPTALTPPSPTERIQAAAIPA